MSELMIGTEMPRPERTPDSTEAHTFYPSRGWGHVNVLRPQLPARPLLSLQSSVQSGPH
jgi:hypothetical protein